MSDEKEFRVITKRIAAIDLGTNSFHAVIVDIHPNGSFTTVDTLKEMICLGRNGVGKPLTYHDMRLGLEALRKIKMLCDRQKVEEILAYATSAIREAPNGGEFVQKVIDQLSIKILAIPGFKEAELIGYAVQHGMALTDETEMVMDIGGGSTEYVLLNRDEILHRESHKTGVSRTTAQFVRHDPVKKSEIEAMEKFYLQNLKPLLPEIKKHKPKKLIGSSGTMQNIAAMIAARKNLSTSLTINEFEYTAADFRELYESFIGTTRKKRLKTSGLDSKRVEFIVAGLVLVDVILKKTGIKRIHTSVQAMREGIILEYVQKEMGALKLLADYPKTRERTVIELVNKFRWHEKHSRQVASLALRLFDSLQSVHNIDETDRELLEYACLMHDIGYHISKKKHHKHSLYIILNSELKGFKQEEIEVMAHVARYHRRSVPHKRHTLYNELSEDQKTRIRKLSAFMRVADGLDRSHFQNIIDLKTELSDKLTIKVTSLGDPELEIWGAMRKCELMEELTGKKLEVVSVKKLTN